MGSGYRKSKGENIHTQLAYELSGLKTTIYR